MILSESDVRSIFKTAFDAAKAEQVELALAGYDETNREIVCGRMAVVRFSNSYIRDNTEVRPYYPLTIKVASGSQEGIAVTNQLDPDGIRAAVGQAEQIARAARPTEEHLPPLGRQEYPVIAAHDARTANAGAAERLAKVSPAIADLQKKGLNGSGYFRVEEHLEAYATSAGNWLYRPSTSSGYSVTYGPTARWAGPRAASDRAGPPSAMSGAWTTWTSMA